MSPVSCLSVLRRGTTETVPRKRKKVIKTQRPQCDTTGWSTGMSRSPRGLDHSGFSQWVPGRQVSSRGGDPAEDPVKDHRGPCRGPCQGPRRGPHPRTPLLGGQSRVRAAEPRSRWGRGLQEEAMWVLGTRPAPAAEWPGCRTHMAALPGLRARTFPGPSAGAFCFVWRLYKKVKGCLWMKVTIVCTAQASTYSEPHALPF